MIQSTADFDPQKKVEIVRYAYQISDRDISADIMGDLLNDPGWTTWKMFESLASDYLQGNADVQKGIDYACSAITGWEFSTIANMVIERCEAEYEDDEY